MTSLNELRHSGYIRAIVHYDDGSVYFYTWGHAYTKTDETVKQTKPELAVKFRRYIDDCGTEAYHGHDDSPLEFELAKKEAYSVEWINGVLR